MHLLPDVCRSRSELQTLLHANQSQECLPGPGKGHLPEVGVSLQCLCQSRCRHDVNAVFDALKLLEVAVLLFNCPQHDLIRFPSPTAKKYARKCDSCWKVSFTYRCTQRDVNLEDQRTLAQLQGCGWCSCSLLTVFLAVRIAPGSSGSTTIHHESDKKICCKCIVSPQRIRVEYLHCGFLADFCVFFGCVQEVIVDDNDCLCPFRVIILAFG